MSSSEGRLGTTGHSTLHLTSQLRNRTETAPMAARTCGLFLGATHAVVQCRQSSFAPRNASELSMKAATQDKVNKPPLLVKDCFRPFNIAVGGITMEPAGNSHRALASFAASIGSPPHSRTHPRCGLTDGMETSPKRSLKDPRRTVSMELRSNSRPAIGRHAHKEVSCMSGKPTEGHGVLSAQAKMATCTKD